MARCTLVLLMLMAACAAAAQPEMDVQRDGDSIADGGADTATNTGTSPFNITYTIRNDGTTDLSLTAMPEVVISSETNCTVTQLAAPATTISAAGTTTFLLRVTPTSTAGFSFAVSIDNDDADENPYNWAFSGSPFSSGSSSKGGSAKDEGCSTTGASNPVWAALAASALLALLRRPRRRLIQS